MKKPTLEEVKEHFKDAKVVKDRYGDYANLDKLNEGFHNFTDYDVWVTTKDELDILVYDSKSEEYAEIIEYKKHKVVFYDGDKLLFEIETEPFNIPTSFKDGGIVIPESKEEYKLPDFLKQKPMKKVIRLDEPKEEKPIELTHFVHLYEGWTEMNRSFQPFDKIVYLGYCKEMKVDKFACYHKSGAIELWKGHLNDGVY